MSIHIFYGKWGEIKSLVKLTWRNLSDDDVKEIEKCPQLIYRKLKSYYGYSQEHAERALDTFNLMTTGEEYKL